MLGRLVVLEAGLGLESGLESIFAGLGLDMKGLGLGLAVSGLGHGPYCTCYKAHSLQVCFTAYNNKFIDNRPIVTGFMSICP